MLGPASKKGVLAHMAHVVQPRILAGVYPHLFNEGILNWAEVAHILLFVLVIVFVFPDGG